MSSLDAIHPDIRPFAEKLLAYADFTVYAAANPKLRADGTPLPLRFFHYSREVAGQTCYGTVTMTEFDGPAVHMPRTPSRVHGSSVGVAKWVTLESMTRAASPSNTQYWEPHGWQHTNARPWGVPDTYAPIPKIDTQSSASRQHFIDTGEYLTEGEQA